MCVCVLLFSGNATIHCTLGHIPSGCLPLVLIAIDWSFTRQTPAKTSKTTIKDISVKGKSRFNE